jgi:hypothetical protein
MNKPDGKTLTLALAADNGYLDVAVNFAENSVRAFGLGNTESLQMRLAVEEIFIYISRSVCAGESIQIECTNGVYYAQVCFRFPVSKPNLRGLNITSSFSYDGESDLEEMGLMLASQSVDHLQIRSEKNQRISLILKKEKAYPESDEEPAVPESAEGMEMETPDAERLKVFSLLAAGSGPDAPLLFKYPGKVVDMAASGEYFPIIAVNRRREIVGGILYSYRSERTVQLLGPFIFHQGKAREIGEALLEDCIGKVARSKALGLLSFFGLPEFLAGGFEPLGSLDYFSAGNPPVPKKSFYRHLHEDPGCEVWTHESIAGYLREEYDRLFLARSIRTVRDRGEARDEGASLFAAEIHREWSQAILRPLWAGSDYRENVGEHVRLLRGDGLLNLFFELDLGIPWHAGLIPALDGGGFKPGIVLPFAGVSDIVIFQYHDASES